MKITDLQHGQKLVVGSSMNRCYQDPRSRFKVCVGDSVKIINTKADVKNGKVLVVDSSLIIISFD